MTQITEYRPESERPRVRITLDSKCLNYFVFAEILACQNLFKIIEFLIANYGQ